jgi:serine/threonine protein kinase
LNHPNIAIIHGLEKSQGIYALVMELVEGEDLSQRIARGPIPLDEALPLAKQIGEALEAAHEQGIIHRDLKPPNIKVRNNGTVKVLDFGLAKLAETSPADSNPSMSLSPTITSPALMSGVGVLLGTAAYMSPEQAKGRPADKRSEIWAFGCVLYEMLTGKRAFEGEDITEVLASIIKGEPDWSALPTDLPQAVRTLIERCLAKDRVRRVSDIGAAKFVLSELSSISVNPVAAPARRSTYGQRITLIPVLVAAVMTALIVGAGAWVLKPTIHPPIVAQFSFALPEGRPSRARHGRLLEFPPMGRASPTSPMRGSISEHSTNWTRIRFRAPTRGP